MMWCPKYLECVAQVTSLETCWQHLGWRVWGHIASSYQCGHSYRTCTECTSSHSDRLDTYGHHTEIMIITSFYKSHVSHFIKTYIYWVFFKKKRLDYFCHIKVLLYLYLTFLDLVFGSQFLAYEYNQRLLNFFTKTT